MSAQPTVLVAEPDPAVRARIANGLRADRYHVVEAGDGEFALRQAFELNPGAALVSLDLPGISGVELVRVLRAASDMAILVIAGSHSSTVVVRALDGGADDCIPRNVHLAELTARVAAAYRRASRGMIDSQRGPDGLDEVVRTGPIEISLSGYSVRKHGNPIRMTRTEYLLLQALGKRAGQAAPYRYLMTEVWGAEYLDDTHYLRGHVASLRAKIEDDPSVPAYLLTERGVGYRLAVLDDWSPARLRSIGLAG